MFDKIIRIFFIQLFCCAFSERFYRSLLFKEGTNNFTDVDEKCWLLGKYNSYGTCLNFPNKPKMADIRKFEIYTQMEIRYICQQMWLQYDPTMKMCIKGDYLSHLRKTPTRYEINDPKLKVITSKEQYREFNKFNRLSCLKAGLDYDKRIGKCDFLKMHPFEWSRINATKYLLTRNHLYEEIWEDICGNYRLTYNNVLKICADRQTGSNWREPLAYPKVTYRGNREDRHEAHLYCTLIGMDYNSRQNKCVHFTTQTNYNKLLRDYSFIFIHAKEVMCADVGMIYHRQLDICIQTEEMEVRRRKRHAEFCDDPGCNSTLSTRIYGPLMRRIVSKNDEICLNIGMLYKRGIDMCEDFPTSYTKELKMAYHIRYLPNLHTILRLHCFKNNLGYSRELRICVDRVVTDEYNLQRFQFTKPKEYESYKRNLCLKLGKDYDEIKDTCIPLPIDPTNDDIEFFKTFRKLLVKIACEESRRIYQSSINYCPTRTETSNGTFTMERLSLVKKYCVAKDHLFDIKLQLCRDRHPPVYTTKRSYIDFMFAHCHALAHGMMFNKELDACVRHTNPEVPVNYQLLREQQYRAMCAADNLDYDVERRYCIVKRTWYERQAPKPPETIDHKDKNPYGVCFRAGLYYDADQKGCRHYEEDMMGRFDELHFKKHYGEFYREAFREICRVDGMPYSEYLNICAFTVPSNKYIEHKEHQKGTPKVKYTDYWYCSLNGLMLDVYYIRHRAYGRCVPFHKDKPNSYFFGPPRTQQIRQVFLNRRCPVYMEYNTRVNFCVRRMIKRISIFSSLEVSYDLTRRYVMKCYRRDQPSCGEFFFERAECCMRRGMSYTFYNFDCSTVPAYPTTLDKRMLDKYENSLFRMVNFRNFCKKNKMEYDKKNEVCVESSFF